MDQGRGLECVSGLATGQELAAPGDVRVVEIGKRLPFITEAAQDLLSIHAALDDLHGDALFVLGIIAEGEVHISHSSGAEELHDSVGTDPLPEDGIVGELVDDLRPFDKSRCFQEVFNAVARMLKISPRTVKRDWRLAKSWLHRAMSGDAE